MDPKMSLMGAMKDPKNEFYVPETDFEYVPIKGTKKGVKSFNGHLFPIICRNATLAKTMKVRDDDTFVITYPKAGTHWVGEICWLIKNNQDFERSKSTHQILRTPFIDKGLSDKYVDQLESPRVFMSHFELEFLPEDLTKKAKIVYVVRNPKDTIVSLYFFLKSMPDDEYEGRIEDMFESFCKGEIIYGHWWNHIDTYRQLENVHIVHYEDLLEDPINETRKIAKHLGKDLNDDQIKAIVDYCTFNKLKSNPAFETKMPAGFLAGKELAKNDENQQGPPQMKELKLFRKGEIGDWKNYFTEEMSKKIDELVKANLKYSKPFKYEPTAKVEN